MHHHGVYGQVGQLVQKKERFRLVLFCYLRFHVNKLMAPTGHFRLAPFVELDYGSFRGKRSLDGKIEQFHGIPFVRGLK